MGDKWTVPQAAREIKVTESMIRRHLRNGVLFGKKGGRDWFLSTDEVARYKAARENGQRMKRNDP